MPRSRTLTLALALVLAAAAPACSKRAETIVGNERMARGPGGLGDTAREATPLDRDTYLTTGTADRSTALLAGVSGAYEARILLKVGAVSLPDTTDLTVVIDSIRLELPFDGKMSVPDVDLQLHTAATAWDTTTVEWPGPGLGSALATANAVDAIGDFWLEMGSGSFGLVKSWAIDPTSLNGFVVRRLAGTGVAGFRAGAGRVRIVYHHDVSGVSTRATADTPISSDLFIHSPLASATGADTTLILGGLYSPVVAFRAPIDSFAPGFSLDEARVVFRVRSDSPTFPDSVFVTVEARRVQNSWTEATTDTTGLGISTVFLDRVVGYQVRDVSDTLLIVPVPAALVRDWSSGYLANEGIVFRIGESYRANEIWLYSRESSKPPEFRISTTSPPPGRF